jgi:hypothetical protein
MILPTSNLLRCSLIAIASITAVRGTAAIFLTQNFSGTLASGNTFGGEAIPENTAFSYSAIFDTTAVAAMDGFGAFSVTDFSVTLGGYGTFHVDPAIWVVVVSDGSAGPFAPYYLAGLIRDIEGEGSQGFYSGFSSATPSFTVGNLVPTVFSGYSGTLGLPFTIDLPGVAGGLMISSFSSASMSITPVPEPAETAVTVGLSLVAYTFIRRKRATAVG